MTDNYKYIIRSYQSYLSWFLDWCGWCSTSSPKDFDPTKFRESQKWFWHFMTFLYISEIFISWHFYTFSIHFWHFMTFQSHFFLWMSYQRPRRPGRFPGVASPEHQPTSRHFQASAWPCWETGGWPSLGKRSRRPMATWEVPPSGEIQTIEILILLEFNHVDCPIK